MFQHRMRSRRGGTRGGSIRSPTTPSSNSYSPASSADNPNLHISFARRYLNTRNRRGRSWLHVKERENAVAHTANFPLPLHSVPHTTQFRFCSTLNRPVTIATVTITFTEETDLPTPLSVHNDELNKAKPSNRSTCDPSMQRANEDRATLYGKALASCQRAKEGKLGNTQASGSRRGDTSGMRVDARSIEGIHPSHGSGMLDEDDNSDKYACLIMEEPAMDNL